MSNSISGSLQKRLGARIRERRVALALSQEKLAEVAGLHRTYVGSIERGERNISLNNLLRIAQSLNLRVIDLFQGLENP